MLSDHWGVCQQQIIRIDDGWLKKSIKEIWEFVVLTRGRRQQLVVSNMIKYQWLLEEIVYDRPRLRIRRPVDPKQITPEWSSAVEPTRRVRLVIRSSTS